MAIDQVSEMSPRAEIRATPIDPMIKADAQKASARTLRFCNQESSSKKPATAETNAATTKSVSISSDMEAPPPARSPKFQPDLFLCQGSHTFDVAAPPA